jgi:hypothetical protein
MLCQSCLRLFAGRAENADEDDSNFYKIHHPNLASFRVAKDLGCGICTKAWHKFLPDRRSKEVVDGGTLITATAVGLPLSAARTTNILQFDQWRRTNPDGRKYMVMNTNGVFEGRWMKMRGNWYLNFHCLGFELILTGVSLLSWVINQILTPSRSN